MTGGSHLSMSHPPAAREPSRPAGLVSLHPELAPQPLIDQRKARSLKLSKRHRTYFLLNNKVCERTCRLHLRLQSQCPTPLRAGLLGPRVVFPHPQGLQGSHLNLS